MNVYHSFDDWVKKVPPAPRCRDCDSPLGLGEVANGYEAEAGLEDWLCLSCATHLARGWPNVTECGIPARNIVEEGATCRWCQRNRETREHEANAR